MTANRCESPQCQHSQHPSHNDELPNLNRISGQIEGIKKMIEDRRYCPDILTQIRAIRAAIKNLELRILDTHLSNCVTKACLSQDQTEQRKKIDEVRDLIRKFE